MKGRAYIACDLKSFYASVECIERNLDSLTTNLVVADAGRTEKTICLAVSPSLKAYGIWAKHTQPDQNGVRIAEMDEMSYRRLL